MENRVRIRKAGFALLSGCLLTAAAGCQTPDLPAPAGVFFLSIFESSSSGTSSSGEATASSPSKKIFVTAAVNNGSLGGVSGADNLCMTDASNPGSGTYKALLVDDSGARCACTTNNCAGGGTTEHVDWVLAADTTYVRSDTNLTIGTTNSSGIFPLHGDGLDNPFLAATNVDYWTGLNANWQHLNSCDDWSNGTSGATGDRGRSDFTGQQSISFAPPVQCHNTVNLLCVEQ